VQRVSYPSQTHTPLIIIHPDEQGASGGPSSCAVTACGVGLVGAVIADSLQPPRTATPLSAAMSRLRLTVREMRFMERSGRKGAPYVAWPSVRQRYAT